MARVICLHIKIEYTRIKFFSCGVNDWLFLMLLAGVAVMVFILHSQSIIINKCFFTPSKKFDGIFQN
ncbi:hypothetical protein AAW31_05095 [Nitrosomonas communis]|uniref:Uncharacterized protein n=1 Tax=Nitrosomonas communis TaxID=44574 RepID=A0A0F7KDY6_9PROT|nr:hypothetical protein AAW31_05095 [Nitrosomonas communis]